MERLGRTYGDDVLLRVVREGGEEALEAAVKYGDDVVEIFQRSSPAARQRSQISSGVAPFGKKGGSRSAGIGAKARAWPQVFRVLEMMWGRPWPRVCRWKTCLDFCIMPKKRTARRRGTLCGGGVKRKGWARL